MNYLREGSQCLRHILAGNLPNRNRSVTFEPTCSVTSEGMALWQCLLKANAGSQNWSLTKTQFNIFYIKISTPSLGHSF